MSGRKLVYADDIYRYIKSETTPYGKGESFSYPVYKFGLEIMKYIGRMSVAYDADWRERLKEYEDLEEQGLLMKLPCKAGDTLYLVDMDDKVNAEIKYFTIDNIVIRKDGEVMFKDDAYDGVICFLENIIMDKLYLDIYRVFLTQAETEEVLNSVLHGRNRQKH